MRLRMFFPVIALAVLLCGFVPSFAQQKKGQQDFAIDAKMQTEVIEGLIAKLNDGYVFPEVAKKMEDAVRARMAKGEYDKIESAMYFCQVLTGHLREVSKDQHLLVNCSKEPWPKQAKITPEKREQSRQKEAESNFGFVKCERLLGNIGYLEFHKFVSPDEAGDTAVAAFSYLANTDALILDVRWNGGGQHAMVAFMCSFFFDAGSSVHLDDVYTRTNDSTKQYWTLPYLPGKRYVGKPVYVLTSKATFSAAEVLAYDLQALKRATIVGETTGGGAHQTGNSRINAHFNVRVPYGRNINAVTKTNWEGTGVTPDIECAADHAPMIGHLAALKILAESTTDQMKLKQFKLFISITEKKLNELKKK